MVNVQIEGQTDQQLRILQLIHMAILFSLVSYLVIGFLLRPVRLPPWELKVIASWVRGFYFLSAVLIALIYFLRKKINHKLKTITSSTENVSNHLRFYRNGYLLIYGLCETVGLLGLLLLFLTGSLRHFLNLIVVSFILMIILYPRKIIRSSS